MEVGGGAAVEEGDEGAVLVWQKPDGLDLATAYVAKDLLCGSLRRNVAQVYGPASSRDETRRDRHGGAESTKTLCAVTRETSGRRLRTTEETAGGRHHVLVKLR